MTLTTELVVPSFCEEDERNSHYGEQSRYGKQDRPEYRNGGDSFRGRLVDQHAGDNRYSKKPDDYAHDNPRHPRLIAPAGAA